MICAISAAAGQRSGETSIEGIKRTAHASTTLPISQSRCRELGDPIPVLISQVLMPTVASLVSSIRGAFHASCDSVGLIV